MTGTTKRRIDTMSPDAGDLLDQLTTAHAERFNQYGPVFDMPEVISPIAAGSFAAEQARLAAAIQAESNPGMRAGLLLNREAQRHEQIGRLAVYVAGYEAIYGDSDDAVPIRQLGHDHLAIAADMRQTIATSHVRQQNTNLTRVEFSQRGQEITGLEDLLPDAARAEVERANQRQFDRAGRGY